MNSLAPICAAAAEHGLLDLMRRIHVLQGSLIHRCCCLRCIVTVHAQHARYQTLHRILEHAREARAEPAVAHAVAIWVAAELDRIHNTLPKEKA